MEVKMTIDAMDQLEQNETNAEFADPTKKVEEKDQEQFASYDEAIKSMEMDFRVNRLNNLETNELNKFRSEYPDGQILFAPSSLQPVVGIEKNPNLYGKKGNPNIFVGIPERTGEDRHQYNQRTKQNRIEWISQNDEDKFAEEAMNRVIKMVEDLSTLNLFPQDEITELNKARTECIGQPNAWYSFNKKVNDLFSDPRVKVAEVMYANLKEAESIGIIPKGKVMEYLKAKVQ